AGPTPGWRAWPSRAWPAPTRRAGAAGRSCVRGPRRRRSSGASRAAWPTLGRCCSATWTGQLTDPRPLPYLQVLPEAVVDVAVDLAFEHGRWRHPVTFVRYRPDLSRYDIPRHTATWP